MIDLKASIALRVKQLGGTDSENAYHSLIEAEDTIVPLLVEAFHVERNSQIRSSLVEIIWQHRLPETAEFLTEAINDSNPEVWKSALDGLVTLGGQLAIQSLEFAKEQIQASGRAKSIKIEWIDEAIQQVRNQDM